MSPNVNKCSSKSHNIVYCSPQLIVVTVVNSVFCSKSGQKWKFGSKNRRRRPWRRRNEGKRVLVSHIFATPMVHHYSYVLFACYTVWKMNLDSGGGFCWCFCWRMCTKLGHLRVWDLWEAYCSRFSLIVLKFKDPIVVMLTLLTLKTLLQVNVKLLYRSPVAHTCHTQFSSTALARASTFGRARGSGYGAV